MAASTQDVQSLVTKLRGKGLDDAQVTESLRGMGYSKADAAAAVGSGTGSDQGAGGSGRSSSRPKPTDAGGGAPAPGGGTSAFGGQLMPSLPSIPTPTLKPPRKLDSGDVAGFLTGLLFFTLGLNYLRYGPSGVTGWLSAKFLNKVTVNAAPSGGFRAGSKGTAADTSEDDDLPFGLELPGGLTGTKPRVP